MSDSEAWLELCDVYLQEHEYDKAAFCMEELLLCKPYNHLVHQKYAEVTARHFCRMLLTLAVQTDFCQQVVISIWYTVIVSIGPAMVAIVQLHQWPCGK